MAEMENCSDLVIKVELVKEGGEDHSVKKRKLEGDENERTNAVQSMLESEEQKSNSLDETEKMINDDLEKMLLHVVTENDLIDDGSEMNGNDILQTCDSPDPAWQKFVGELRVKVCGKKRQFLGFVNKKKAVLSLMEKIEEIKTERQKSIKLINLEMLSNQEEIEKLREEIKIRNKLNAQMQVYVKQESSKVKKTSRSIQNVGSTFNKIEEEIASVLEMSENKPGPVERDDVEVNKLEFDNLKELLNGVISCSKSKLTCPGCQEMCSPPIYKCPAEHLICNTCYTGRVKTRCPECRLQLDMTGQSSRFRTAEVAWKELKNIEDKLNQQ